MSNIVITYMALVITSLSGAFIFFGFAWLGPRRASRQGRTVRFQPKAIPLNWVTLHVTLATITLAIFTYTMLVGAGK